MWHSLGWRSLYVIVRRYWSVGCVNPLHSFTPFCIIRLLSIIGTFHNNNNMFHNNKYWSTKVTVVEQTPTTQKHFILFLNPVFTVETEISLCVLNHMFYDKLLFIPVRFTPFTFEICFFSLVSSILWNDSMEICTVLQLAASTPFNPFAWFRMSFCTFSLVAFITIQISFTNLSFYFFFMKLNKAYKWKTTSMEDNLNIRWPEWRTTSTEDDLNRRQPQWKTT